MSNQINKSIRMSCKQNIDFFFKHRFIIGLTEKSIILSNL